MSQHDDHPPKILIKQVKRCAAGMQQQQWKSLSHCTGNSQ